MNEAEAVIVIAIVCVFMLMILYCVALGIRNMQKQLYWNRKFKDLRAPVTSGNACHDTNDENEDDAARGAIVPPTCGVEIGEVDSEEEDVLVS